MLASWTPCDKLWIVEVMYSSLLQVIIKYSDGFVQKQSVLIRQMWLENGK